MKTWWWAENCCKSQMKLNEDKYFVKLWYYICCTLHLEYSKRQQTSLTSLKTSKLCYEIDDKMFFKSVKFFVSGFRIVYHLLDNVSLCTGKTATKLAPGFFLLVFFIVRLPHWVLDLSLNAQPFVNKFYLLFIYIPHFMMKLCRMCSKYLLSVLFFICFCDITQ